MKYCTFTRSLIVTIALLTAALAQAHDYGEGLENFAPAIALDNTQGRHDHWRGVGRLKIIRHAGASRCTASLIDSRRGPAQASGPAYILTSGHCVNRNPLNFSTDQALTGYVEFDYFLGNLQNTRRYAVKKTVSATMRGNDLALIELDTSLQSLLNVGIQPLAISTDTPTEGMNLMVVGVPSGHGDSPGLRLALCTHEAREDLVEDVYVLRGFHKHRCAGVGPGSSGSPVLDRLTNRIVGVLSTSTKNGKAENRCQENAPCEIDNGHPAWAPGVQYSSPANALMSCFNQGVFNALDSECALRPTLEMTLGDSYSPKPYSRITIDEQGNRVAPKWSWPFSLNQLYYRYKSVRAPSDCESPRHYSSAFEAREALIDDALEPDAGMHFLCIIGVDSPTQVPAWEMMSKPAIIVMEVAAAGPTRMPELTIERTTEGGYNVRPYFSRPSLWVYTFKSGTPESVQCDDPEGYLPTFAGVKTIEAQQLPMMLCSKAYDLSRQASLPRSDLLLP
nr:trypsin-like peptidase domain-containing protein [uncultured Pseudomonas sp.]